MSIPLKYEDVIITIIGKKQVHIENFRCICEFTDSSILFGTKNGKLCITGKRLSINYFDEKEMDVSGIIDNISWNI